MQVEKFLNPKLNLEYFFNRQWPRRFRVCTDWQARLSWWQRGWRTGLGHLTQRYFRSIRGDFRRTGTMPVFHVGL
jgi:hypothetical protein